MELKESFIHRTEVLLTNNYDQEILFKQLTFPAFPLIQHVHTHTQKHKEGESSDLPLVTDLLFISLNCETES